MSKGQNKYSVSHDGETFTRATDRTYTHLLLVRIDHKLEIHGAGDTAAHTWNHSESYWKQVSQAPTVTSFGLCCPPKRKPPSTLVRTPTSKPPAPTRPMAPSLIRPSAATTGASSAGPAATTSCQTGPPHSGRPLSSRCDAGHTISVNRLLTAGRSRILLPTCSKAANQQKRNRHADPYQSRNQDHPPDLCHYDNAVKAATKALPDDVRWLVMATEGGRFTPVIVMDSRTAQRYGLLFSKFLKVGSC